MKIGCSLFVSALVAALLVAAPPAAAWSPWSPPSGGSAGSGGSSAVEAAADPIPGRYIVTFDDGAVPEASVDGVTERLTAQQAGDVLFTYDSAIRGFAAEMTEAEAEKIAADPRVAQVEEDGVVSINADDDGIGPRSLVAEATQTGATWGLDRIDQRVLPLDTTYDYTHTGAGVTAYVIDTGIRPTHQDFGGRAAIGTDTVGDGQNGQDCAGHGTHVAGTVGSTTWGVAKEVDLVGVRVLDCSGNGSNAGVIAGIDWVTANAQLPAVANMSLGGGQSASLNAAVAGSVSSGVTYVVAGGNESSDACTRSPASEPTTITVGSTTSSDGRSSFSNFGTCLDLFAPGSSITSTWINSDTDTNTISGTSMASPHVAGVAAAYLEAQPGAGPAAVATAITDATTPGLVTGAGTGSPNLLLFSNFLVTPPALTIEVDAVPDSPQDFEFEGCLVGVGCSQFSLDDDDDGTLSDSATFEELPVGEYTITQTDAGPWELTALVCDTGESIDLAAREATIDLGADEHVRCTFTNDASALTFVQDTVPDGPQDFGFEGCLVGVACSSFSLDDDNDATLGNSFTAAGIPAAQYTITQDDVSGWQLDSLVCDTGESVDLASRTATIDVAEGEHVTCTFTNDASALTFVQDTVPDGPQDFGFEGCLVGVACSSFSLDDDNDATLGNSFTAAGIPAAQYTITQDDVSGWQLDSLVCDTGESVDLASRTATIDVAEGEHVTCTFMTSPAPPDNDDFADATELSGISGNLSGTTVASTAESGEPAHGPNGPARSVWFSWTAPSAGTVTFETCGSSFDTLLAAYTGATVDALTQLDFNDDACGLQSRVAFAADAGVTYAIAVDGYGGAFGSYTIDWSHVAGAAAPAAVPERASAAK